jgi:hypothetical protein
MRKKSAITVKEAAKMAYDSMPDVYHGIIFLIEVRRILHRPSCKDGSIDKRLRELRYKDKVINYVCINNDLSIYKKLEVK